MTSSWQVNTPKFRDQVHSLESIEQKTDPKGYRHTKDLYHQMLTHPAMVPFANQARARTPFPSLYRQRCRIYVSPTGLIRYVKKQSTCPSASLARAVIGKDEGLTQHDQGRAGRAYTREE